MTEMLDRNRPFETSWGFVSEDEPFFYQDNKEFNSKGERINIPEEELNPSNVEKPKPAKRGRKAKAEEPVVSEGIKVEDLNPPEPPILQDIGDIVLPEPKTPENIEENSDLL